MPRSCTSIGQGRRSSPVALLTNAKALAWFQLDFTDINLVAFGFPADDSQVVPFVHIRLVDTALTPKPALASWDSVFALTRVLELPCAAGCVP